LVQASVALEEFPLRADNRPGGNGGKLVVPVWLAKGSMRDTQAAQPIEAIEQLPFIGNADHDKMRVRTI
jgi:hypothetical protein